MKIERYLSLPRRTSVSDRILSIDDERQDFSEHGDAYVGPKSHPRLARAVELGSCALGTTLGLASGLALVAGLSLTAPLAAVPVLGLGLGGLALARLGAARVHDQLAPRGFSREVRVREGQTRTLDSQQLHRGEICQGPSRLIGDGKIEPELFAELQAKTGDAEQIQDLRDPRLADIVRSFGHAAFRERTGSNLLALGPRASLRLKETVLSRPRLETSDGTPYQSIRIGRADGLIGRASSQELRPYLGLVNGEQVCVRLQAHGAYDIQSVSGLFRAATGELIPGTVQESFLHSDLPLPS